MQFLNRLINGLIVAFRSGARTVGLSPKVLAAPIAALIAGALALVGLTPEVIGSALHVKATVVLGAEGAIATVIATWLLPPGNVQLPDPQPEPQPHPQLRQPLPQPVTP